METFAGTAAARWVPPSRVFLIHGEEDGLNGLQQQIQQRLHWPTHIPTYLERVELNQVNPSFPA